MDNSWMLAEVMQVPGVLGALVASADGLVTHHDDRMPRDRAERFAAVVAGVQTLGANIGAELGKSGDALRQAMYEFGGAYAFVRRAGEGSLLLVLAEATVDPGLIAQQMARQVQRIGERNLSTAARSQP